MSTKTASVRLDRELFDRIDSHCVSFDCSRNDFIKSAIESALEVKKDDDAADHASHNDSYGNYWTWNDKEGIWTCHLNS